MPSWSTETYHAVTVAAAAAAALSLLLLLVVLARLRVLASRVRPGRSRGGRRR